MGILEGIVGPLLQKYLGAYFEGLDNLDISLFSSQTSLTNLKLKTSALDELELPVSVQYGLLEKLHLKIPILSLGSEPVIVNLSGLHIVAGPKHRESASDAEERERLERTKKRRLQLADLLGLDQPIEEEDEETKVKRLKKAEEENDSVLGKLKMKILNNIQIKVENIHIRYQDDLSNPENPFALGITLDELYAESADENWVPGWIKRTKSTIIRKLVRLQNLCIYFDTPSKPPTTGSQTSASTASSLSAAPGTTQGPTSTPTTSAPSTISGPVAPMLKLPQGPNQSAPAVSPQKPSAAGTTGPSAVAPQSAASVIADPSNLIYKFANDQQMCQVLTALTYKKSRAPNQQPAHNYILAPFSAQLKLVLDISEDMANFTRPKVQVDTKVEDIQLALNQAQFFGALDLFQYFSLYINSLKYLNLRPAQLNDKTLHLPENRSKLARLRWSYVIACVRHDVRQRVDTWSWSSISQRKKDRVAYTEIFKRIKSGKKVEPFEEEQVRVLEKTLHYEDIIVYRKLAYAAIIHDKKKKRRRRSKDSSKPAAVDPKKDKTPSKDTKDSKDKDKAKEKEKEKEKEKSKAKEKEKPKEEESILDRLFGFTKSDKEKERDRQRALEKAEKERRDKIEKERRLLESKGVKVATAEMAVKAHAQELAQAPQHQDVSTAVHLAPVANLEAIDEDELLKELYESIGFDNAKQAEHSDYPKDYIHTKLSFHVVKGRLHLTEVDPKLPVVATFSFSNVYTGIRLSGVNSLNLDGYVESCDMVEYHTLGGPTKPFPVVQRDEAQHAPDAPLQHIFSFTVGTNTISPSSQSADPVDLDLSILALPLLITISRPFIDRMLVFFDLYGRDDISEHLSELAEKSFESMKQRAEAQLKYALGARKTLLVNAIVHAPRIQIPSDYQDPFSPIALLDLGIITVMADTTSRPDSKVALSRVKALRETGPIPKSASPGPASTDLALSHIDENYFFDRIVMKLSGINAGVVRKRTAGEPRHPPPKDSPEIIALLSKVDASITLSICNTQTHDLARARIDANITMLKVHANKAIMGTVFDVVRTAVKDTRPVDPVREAEVAEKARLRRIQLILWSEDLGDDAPALHALLNGMDAVNRRRQNLAAFLDFDDSETETDTDTTDTDSVDFSESEDMSLAESFGSARSTMHTSRSTTSLAQVKERLRAVKVKPAKKQFEFKLIETHFQLDGISVGLSEMIDGAEYPVITLMVNQLKAQLNASDQSLVLSTSLLSFALQEHITERTSFGNSEIAKGEHYIIRSTAPPGTALIDIGYEQLDRRCSRYNNIDHNVKLAMQGLEVTVSRLTIASLIVVATELATSIQSAMGLAAKSSIVDLSLASSHPELRSPSPSDKLLLPPPVSTILASDSESEADDSSSAAAAFTDDNVSEQSEIEDIKRREYKKAAQLAMVKAAVQEGIELAHIELSLKEVVVQLNKEGSPFFKTSISNAKAEVGIFPDHTTEVQGSLSQVRCSARSNDAGVPIWTVERATSEVPFVPASANGKDTSPIDGTRFAPPPTASRVKLSTSTTAERTPYEWTDIIYVDEDCFGSFSLKVYDPSMPSYPGVDMDVKASVGGLRAVVLFRIVDEIITYLTAFKSMLGVIGYLQAAQSNDQPEPKTRLTIEVSTPIIYIPRSTESREFISVALGETMITNRLDTIAGVKYDFMTVNVKGLGISAVVRNTECTGLVERRILENLDLCLSVNRAIEGNDDHLLPDVEVSSSIEQIRIHVSAADLLLIPGLLGGNFSEFVLRKDEIELKEAISFLESVNLIQFISNLVPLSEVANLSSIPFTKVRVSFAIAGVNATLYRGAGVLENGDDSALISGLVSTLDIGVIVTSDEGVQLSMNIDRIEVLDCSRNTPNKFRYILFPNHGFETAQPTSIPSTPRTPSNPILARRLSVSSGMSASTPRSHSMSVSGPLGRSSALHRPNPFFKLRYEDRPSEATEFVTVTLSHPRIYIVPYVLEELLGIFMPFIGSIVSALDTWHQRLIFGSEAEQRDVLANAITALEARHREEIAQLIAQHRNNISTMRSNKKSSPKDEETMMMAQESTRKLVLDRQKQELQDLRHKGIVPKWTNPNEMRVKVEISNPEICIVERSTALTSPSFVVSLGHVILRISVLPEMIDIEPNVSDIGVYKATLDSSDAAATIDNVMLLQPFDLTGSVRIRPPMVKQPTGLADILLKVGLVQTIVSYRDVRLGVEVFRSFEPMINKIVALVSDLGAVAEEASKLQLAAPQRDDLVLQLKVKQMLFSLLNDHNPLFVVPVAKVNLGDVVALIQTNEAKNITLQVGHLTAAGFNNSLSSYEPLIEPWSIDVKILERANNMNIHVQAEQRTLNINVTRSLFDAVFGIIAFADDMKALLDPDESVRILKKGAAAAASPFSAGGDDTWENSSSRTGVISSPTLSTSASSSSTPQKSSNPSSSAAGLTLNDFIGHQRKASSSLTADTLGELGADELRASPGPEKSLSNPSTVTTTGAERSFDPFLVRNDTNESLRVWKSTERPDSGFVLAPGTQMSLRSEKSSKHAADTAFYVNVDITIGTSILALEHIPIEKVHSQVYSLRNDRSVKILSEVTLKHGTKILTLSTVHYIRNSTIEPIEVQIVSPAGAKHEMTIPSQQTRSIPIRFCDYKEIKLRPLGGYLWYTRYDKSADGIVNCYSDDRTSNRSWSCCLTYSSRTLEGGKDYCIALTPQLILENLLCSDMLIKTYTPTVKMGASFSSAISAVSSVFGRSRSAPKAPVEPEEDEATRQRELAFTIEVGDQLPVFAAQAADSVVKQTYRIQIPGCNWSDNLDMGELFSHQKVGFSFERALTLQEVSGRQILIYVLVHCPSPGCMRVSFFSKYWLINQTGLVLGYRTNSKSKPQVDDPRSISMVGNPREWYKTGLMSELAAQRTYWSTGELSLQIMATLPENSSPWSHTFTLEQKEEEQVQQAKVELVSITDPRLQRTYTFKMEIANAPGKHWRTKQVRISPAVMLINKTDLTLWYDQWTPGAKLKARSPTCFDLKPGERIPYHWSQVRTKQQRLIFTTDEAYNASKDPMQIFWSVPFRLSKLDSFVVKIRTGPDTPPGSDHLIKAQIIERENVLCVVFRNAAQDTIPFYKIDNRTNMKLLVEQAGFGGSLEHVPPRSIQDWYWENPLEPADSRGVSLRLADGSVLSTPYKTTLDRTIVGADSPDGRPELPLPSWEIKLRGAPVKVRMRLVQQGFVKILVVEIPTYGSRPVATLSPNKGSTDLAARIEESNDILKVEEKVIDVQVRISGIGISLIDHFRGRVPNELVYVTLLGLHLDLDSRKQVHNVKFQVKKIQVDNQMKFAPEPVLLTSVRAPIVGTKRASDYAPFLAATLEIDSSEESLVYIREMKLELQVLDVSVDQQFILAMAGFGDALAKYIAVQSGLEQSVQSREKTLPAIEDADLVAPGIFVQSLAISPVKLVLSLVRGVRLPGSEPPVISPVEAQIRRYTDIALGLSRLQRITIQLGAFNLERVNASGSDLGTRFGNHYQQQGFANISKVLFNYISLLKLFASDPPPRSPIRLPRYFPHDYLVVPYDTAKAYGQKLLVDTANGKYANDVYLFHLWLGGSVHPMVIITTSEHIVLLSSETGVHWDERMDTFVDIQVTKPPEVTATSASPLGAMGLFFDKETPDENKRTLSQLPVEQMNALERSFRAISKEKRSTSQTFHQANLGQSLTSSWS